MGKGSHRRPTSIPKAEMEKSWDRIFGNKSESTVNNGEKSGRNIRSGESGQTKGQSQ